jgi:hypothetical protein
VVATANSGRRRAVLVVVVLLVLVAAGAGFRWWQQGRQSTFARAVATAPAGTERVSWTDWAGVRRVVHSTVSAGSSEREVAGFLSAAYDRDLDSRSALVESTPVLQSRFGFSPASADWEVFSQGQQGAVITVRMPDGTDFGAIGDRWESLGYVRPPSEAGVWKGGDDLLASISPDLTPELAYLAVVPEDHLVLASDQAGFLRTAVLAATGDGPRVEGLDAVTGDVGDPLSAAVYTGAYACGALAMAQADAADQARADDLIRQAGTVDPYLAFAMAVAASGEVTVAMEFESGAQARTNADSRAALASGDAVGQGGTFPDRFTLRSAEADGSLLTLDLAPRPRQAVLSDLSTGPLLFATC